LKTKKTTLLKNMLLSDRLEFICEAHNGISAKIVEQAGFSGIWGSGLSISAALGVRDSNEASWTQVLEVMEFMSDATSIPILLDGDTGYGNFNNVRRLVTKLEQRGVAGVCIEDKLFPKTNSFIDGERQPLEDIDIFCGKIKAGKDVQKDDDFCIVARVEAFIAGYGLGEAIKRAEAYRRAGADAILVHSKKRTAEDIEKFMAEWANRHPVVIVPTKYYSTPTDRFRELSISMVIWANHMMRASVSAMQKTAARIFESESIAQVEDGIAPVAEIFRLQGAEELRKAESRYLSSGKEISAVILAASRGSDLGSITENIPKALLKVNNRTIIGDTLSKLSHLKVKNITVVRGFRKELIAGDSFSTIDNPDYKNTRDLYSLYLAREKLHGHCLIIYGDCLYRSHLISDLIDNQADIRILVNAEVFSGEKPRDWAVCSAAYTNDFFTRNIFLKKIITSNIPGRAHGEWAGIIAASPAGCVTIRKTIERMRERPDFKRLSITDLLNEINMVQEIAVVYTKGGWLDIDNVSDYAEAGRFND